MHFVTLPSGYECMEKYFSHDADTLSFLHLPPFINYNDSSDGKCSTSLPKSHTEMDQSSFLAVTIITIVILRSPDTDVFVLLCTKTVHNKTTSYTEIS